jgi:hypothetical protein
MPVVAIYRDDDITLYRVIPTVKIYRDVARGREVAGALAGSACVGAYSGASMPSHWNQPRCSTSQAIRP